MRVINPESPNALIEFKFYYYPDDQNDVPVVRKMSIRMSWIKRIHDGGVLIPDGKNNEMEQGCTIAVGKWEDEIHSPEPYEAFINEWSNWLVTHRPE